MGGDSLRSAAAAAADAGAGGGHHYLDILEAAEHRHSRTWRTTLRPQLTRTAELFEPGQESNAFAPSAERFVRKSRLPPGKWEVHVQADADPATQTLARSGAITLSPKPVNHDNAPRLAGERGGDARGIFGGTSTTGSRGGPSTSNARHARSLNRAVRGQRTLQQIQGRADAAAEIAQKRDEARIAAKSAQQLRYNQAVICD